MMIVKRIAALLGALVCFCAATAAAADSTQAVFDAARQAATEGPADVKLANQGLLKLPAGYAYVPQPHATKVLNAMGNPGDDSRLQGLVFPKGEAPWFATVRFVDAGYIKDDDAKDWNADDLLKSVREGTEQANVERKKNGVAAVQVIGWAEKPAYEATAHRLVWAISAKDENAPANTPQGVNYNTYVLGREGYFSLNLVTSMDTLPQDKTQAQALLSALAFDEGKRYADFNAQTDHVAEYGLAALVAGVAAKKLGFLALAGVFFAKFFKLILVGLALVGGVAAKVFKRKPAT
jgi:uncharacterized membrane-anchored protein